MILITRLAPNLTTVSFMSDLITDLKINRITLHHLKRGVILQALTQADSDVPGSSHGTAFVLYVTENYIARHACLLGQIEGKCDERSSVSVEFSGLYHFLRTSLSSFPHNSPSPPLYSRLSRFIHVE